MSKKTSGIVVTVTVIACLACWGMFGASGQTAAIAAAPLAPECADNSDCSFQEYCASPAGLCGGGTCEIRPGVCIELPPAVCGCDGNDYINACFAASDGVNVDFEGTCAGGGCGERNDPCTTGTDCCSGICKRNGKCR